MTASTLSRLPIMAGSAVAASLGRAGLWTIERYMRAPLASTGVLAMVTLTALAASNALYFQTGRHPAPFFGNPVEAQTASSARTSESAVPTAVPQPMPPSVQQQTAVAAPQVTSPETTGSVSNVAPAIPDSPVGNAQAFAVQKRLAELGLFQGTVDGFYGPMTARAIRAFEERNGLEPTGALTPDIVDAIERADSAGRVPVARPQAAAEPVVPVRQAAPALVPTQPIPSQDRVVAQLPPVDPVDQAVDTVGNAAAQTIDSIVAAVDGARATPVPPENPPTPSLPLVSAAPSKPAPVQMASLQGAPPVAPAPPDTAPKPEPAPVQAEPQPTLAPANNVQLVSQIQRGLASLGFYHGTIDGHPGDATAKAIREFENFYRYQVTGQVKPDLVNLLRDAGASV